MLCSCRQSRIGRALIHDRHVAIWTLKKKSTYVKYDFTPKSVFWSVRRTYVPCTFLLDVLESGRRPTEMCVHSVATRASVYQRAITFLSVWIYSKDIICHVFEQFVLYLTLILLWCSVENGTVSDSGPRVPKLASVLGGARTLKPLKPNTRARSVLQKSYFRNFCN